MKATSGDVAFIFLFFLQITFFIPNFAAFISISRKQKRVITRKKEVKMDLRRGLQ